LGFVHGNKRGGKTASSHAIRDVRGLSIEHTASTRSRRLPNLWQLLWNCRRENVARDAISYVNARSQYRHRVEELESPLSHCMVRYDMR